MSGDRIRFANGYLDDVGCVLAGTHDRASQYLEQAPALAVLACRKMPSHITYGELDQFKAIVSCEPRLKDILAKYGGTAPMRKLSAAALKLSDHVVLAELAKLDNSTLSQVIPLDSQRVWLDGIKAWLRLAPAGKRARKLFNVAWIARQLGENLSRFEQVDALVDYLGRGGDALNEQWSWDRAIAEVAAWHLRLRNDADLARLVRDADSARAFDKVICKSGLPDAAVVDGYDFSVLRTIRRLREEGVAMHHCVAAYAGGVQRGRCAIVSVSRDGVSVATLEINKEGVVAQIKAHCNQSVSVSVRRACEEYALLHWALPQAAAA